jgi:hypothetical protein
MIEFVLFMGALYGFAYLMDKLSWKVFCKYADVYEMNLVRSKIAKRKAITIRYK